MEAQLTLTATTRKRSEEDIIEAPMLQLLLDDTMDGMVNMKRQCKQTLVLL
jgi:hypothetical protein